MNPLVHVLLSVPNPALYDSCTLALDTLRVGFPNSEIVVTLNNFADRDQLTETVIRVKNINALLHPLAVPFHHAAWLQGRATTSEGGRPVVLLDGDTIFWKSCEDWEFPDALMAGYYVPEMWNDFAKCVSHSRLHTSFLWINNPAGLQRFIRDKYPPALQENSDYCPLSPFHPRVMFINGRPQFWDSCSVLYHMMNCEGRGSTHYSQATYFGPEHKACYDHLNSASFYDVMAKRLDYPENFSALHTRIVPAVRRGELPKEVLKDLWQIVDSYYERKRLQAQFGRPSDA